MKKFITSLPAPPFDIHPTEWRWFSRSTENGVVTYERERAFLDGSRSFTEKRLRYKLPRRVLNKTLSDFYNRCFVELGLSKEDVIPILTKQFGSFKISQIDIMFTVLQEVVNDR